MARRPDTPCAGGCGQQTDARLDAIAATRLILQGNTRAADEMILTTSAPADMAAAACSLAATILSLASPEDWQEVLDQLTSNAVSEEGGLI